MKSEKIEWQHARRMTLRKEAMTDIIKEMDEVNDYLDPDYFVTEGIEITNGADQKIAVEIVITRVSGRMFIDIEAIRNDGEENDAKQNGQKIIDAHSHGWVTVKVVDT